MYKCIVRHYSERRQRERPYGCKDTKNNLFDNVFMKKYTSIFNREHKFATETSRNCFNMVPSVISKNKVRGMVQAGKADTPNVML